MKNLTKYLLVSVLAFCCVLGLVACGGGSKGYVTGRFELKSYDLYVDGQIANVNVINDETGSSSQYFIELDNDGNMRIVFITVAYSSTSGKYNLAKSVEKEYTYYINSSDKIIVKEGKATISYDMTINEAKTVITLKSEIQEGNGQVISKFEV